jgi:elongation factor G
VPRQYIGAVEHGAKEYLSRGPLGFPVVDVSVTLYDGSTTRSTPPTRPSRRWRAWRWREGMPNCDPVLLEPIYEVTISVPNEFTNKVHSLVSARRGQILGFEMRPAGRAGTI